MRNIVRSRTALVLAVALPMFTGCGEQAEPVTVSIVQPADGATLPPGDVRVTLTASGVEIAPASEERSGTAHHHLFIDRPLTPSTDTIPAGVAGIIHLGRAQTEFTISGLEPGEHTVIALLADWAHVPLSPMASDTVKFTVAQP